MDDVRPVDDIGGFNWIVAIEVRALALPFILEVLSRSVLPDSAVEAPLRAILLAGTVLVMLWRSTIGTYPYLVHHLRLRSATRKPLVRRYALSEHVPPTGLSRYIIGPRAGSRAELTLLPGGSSLEMRLVSRSDRGRGPTLVVLCGAGNGLGFWRK